MSLLQIEVKQAGTPAWSLLDSDQFVRAADGVRGMFGGRTLTRIGFVPLSATFKPESEDGQCRPSLRNDSRVLSTKPGSGMQTTAASSTAGSNGGLVVSRMELCGPSRPTGGAHVALRE